MNKQAQRRLLDAWRGGASPTELSESEGLSANATMGLLRGAITDADRAERWRNRSPIMRRFTDEELFDALKSVSGKTGKGPTIHAYETARKADPTMPSRQTMTNRFGGWTQALQAAGFDRKAPEGNRAEWTDDQLIAAAATVAKKYDGRLPSIQAYDRVRESNPELPSAVLLRVRLGGWTRVRELARLR